MKYLKSGKGEGNIGVIVLLVIILVLGGILALKITGVIKPKPIEITQKREDIKLKDINNYDSNYSNESLAAKSKAAKSKLDIKTAGEEAEIAIAGALMDKYTNKSADLEPLLQKRLKTNDFTVDGNKMTYSNGVILNYVIVGDEVTIYLDGTSPIYPDADSNKVNNSEKETNDYNDYLDVYTKNLKFRRNAMIIIIIAMMFGLYRMYKQLCESNFVPICVAAYFILSFINSEWVSAKWLYITFEVFLFILSLIWFYNHFAKTNLRWLDLYFANTFKNFN
jgi:hypothetical protein